MRRKLEQKLTLSKETLRSLDSADLAQVEGGDPTQYCFTARYVTCASCTCPQL